MDLSIFFTPKHTAVILFCSFHFPLMCVRSFFGFWLGQCTTGGSCQSAKQFFILKFRDEKARFCPRIRGSGFWIGQYFLPLICNFNKKLVVTNRSKKLSVTVNSIFPKHFLIGNCSSIIKLFCNILYKLFT